MVGQDRFWTLIHGATVQFNPGMPLDSALAPTKAHFEISDYSMSSQQSAEDKRSGQAGAFYSPPRQPDSTTGEPQVGLLIRVGDWDCIVSRPKSEHPLSAGHSQDPESNPDEREQHDCLADGGQASDSERTRSAQLATNGLQLTAILPFCWWIQGRNSGNCLRKQST